MGVVFGMGVGLSYLPHLLVAGEYFKVVQVQSDIPGPLEFFYSNALWTSVKTGKTRYCICDDIIG